MVMAADAESIENPIAQATNSAAVIRIAAPFISTEASVSQCTRYRQGWAGAVRTATNKHATVIG
jgi:hypothetical protein